MDVAVLAPQQACRTVAALVAVGLALTSTASRADAEPINDDVALVEVAAYVQARSAFQRHCFRCHAITGEEATKKSLERLDMSRYPFGGRRGPIAGRAIRQVLGDGGGKPTMPKDDPGGVQGDDLLVISKWADVFDSVRADKDRDTDSTADGGAGSRRSMPERPPVAAADSAYLR